MVDLLTTQTVFIQTPAFKSGCPDFALLLLPRGVFTVLLCWSVECVVCVLGVEELKGSGLKGSWVRVPEKPVFVG